MKSFIAALVLLVLLIGGIAANTATAVRYCNELEFACKNLPPEPGEDAAVLVGRLNDLWSERLSFFRMSVDRETLDAVEEALVQLCIAAECGDVFSYRFSAESFSDGIRSIRHDECPW